MVAGALAPVSCSAGALLAVGCMRSAEPAAREVHLRPAGLAALRCRLNADIVGQNCQRLAEIFGIQVPAWAKVLVAEVSRAHMQRRRGRGLLPRETA